MILDKGCYEVWPDFSIQLEREMFLSGGIHRVTGDNGAGKSSFFKKILLPALRMDSTCYTVYIEQMMKGQFYALKAHAALTGYLGPMSSEQDCLDYLLMDLRLAWEKRPMPIFAIIDESPFLDHLHNEISSLQKEYCLFFSSHQPETIQANMQIKLTLVSPNRSILEFGSV